MRLSACPHPLFFAHAEKTRPWDDDGNSFADLVLTQGPMVLGRPRPVIGSGPVRSARDLLPFDQEKTAQLSETVAPRGRYLITRETRYLSTAHSTADIRSAVNLLAEALDRSAIV